MFENWQLAYFYLNWDDFDGDFCCRFFDEWMRAVEQEYEHKTVAENVVHEHQSLNLFVFQVQSWVLNVIIALYGFHLLVALYNRWFMGMNE